MGIKKEKPKKPSRHIPDSVSNEVQSRHFFECAWCGTHLTERHHIEQYASGGKHTAENLILLCPNCHTQVHSGTISTKDLMGRKSTHKKGDRAESTFHFEMDEPIFKLGGTRFENAPNMLINRGEKLIAWKRNRNNDVVLLVRLYDREGNLVFWMADNRYWSPKDFNVKREKNFLTIESTDLPAFTLKFKKGADALEIEGLIYCRGGLIYLHPDYIYFGMNGQKIYFSGGIFSGEKASLSLAV